MKLFNVLTELPAESYDRLPGTHLNLVLFPGVSEVGFGVSLGVFTKGNSFSDGPYALQTSEEIVCLAGVLEVTLGLERVRLHAGMALYIPAGMPRGFCSVSSEVETRFLSFTDGDKHYERWTAPNAEQRSVEETGKHVLLGFRDLGGFNPSLPGGRNGRPLHLDGRFPTSVAHRMGVLNVSLNMPMMEHIPGVDKDGEYHPVSYGVPVHCHDLDEDGAPVYEVYLVLEGEGIMLVDGELRRVKKGDLVAIPRGKFHQLTNASWLNPLQFMFCYNGSRLANHWPWENEAKIHPAGVDPVPPLVEGQPRLPFTAYQNHYAKHNDILVGNVKVRYMTNSERVEAELLLST